MSTISTTNHPANLQGGRATSGTTNATVKKHRGWAVVSCVLVTAGLCGIVGWGASLTVTHRVAAAGTAFLVVVMSSVCAHWVLLRCQTSGPLSGRPARRSSQAQSEPRVTVTFRRRGLKAAVMGADGRVSTSKTQVVLWTAALLFALVDLLLLTRSVPSGNLFSRAVSDNWRPEYLVLLGFPAAAATAAGAAVAGSNGGRGPVSTQAASKVRAGVPELGGRIYSRDPVQSPAWGVVHGLSDLITDETETVSWPDLQYVAFTVITLIYFFVQVLGAPAAGLPPVPAALLTLMGVSAATYTINKVIQTRGNTSVPDGS